MKRNNYNLGDKIGPHGALLLEITKITSYGHRYGLFLCPCCNKNTFEAKIYHVSSGAIYRCKDCRSIQTSGKGNPNFKNLLGKKFGKLTVVKLVGSDNKKLLGRRKKKKRSVWLCKCDCGGEKLVTTNELTRHNVSSCDECRLNSNGEYRIKELLINLEIPYICQYKFSDCKDTFSLPFDFYLPNLNICIEYDGISHYEANSYGSWRTEASVEKTQKHDIIKNNYCKEHDIKLIRIPYWDYDKLNEEYLLFLIDNKY